LLEAIALRTALVLFPGEYAGILQPWQHYIPLERDFSNAAEVVGALKNDALLQQMVDRTYREIAVSGELSYRTFASRFDVAVDLTLQHLSDTEDATRPDAQLIPVRRANTIGLTLRLAQEQARLRSLFLRILRLLGKSPRGQR
jgi:hypothetical protein